MKFETQAKLETEFGARLTSLVDGRSGLRGGLRCEVKSGGAAAQLDFVASDETLDRYHEVIKLEGWDLTNYRRNPVIVDSHNYGSVARILGKSVSVGITGGKLVNRVEFAVENPLGNLAHKLALGGFINSESVGFIPLEWENGKKDEPDRTYTKCELLEISLVVVPANPGATIGAALKSGALADADLRDLAQFVKQFCNDPASPAAHATAPSGGTHGAEWLQLARACSGLLRRG